MTEGPRTEAEERHDDGFPEALRVRLPERDPDALAAFFDAYFDRVYGYVRRLVRDEHLAEDLTQDVFLHVQRALPSYDPSRSLRPWVFTIATNKLRDHWRSRRHRDTLDDDRLDGESAAASVPSEGPGAEEELSEREMAEQVRAAVDALPDGMRVTVLLRVYEGLSFEAIGEIVGRTDVAVRKRYSRALEVLRETMGPAWKVHSEGAQ